MRTLPLLIVACLFFAPAVVLCQTAGDKPASGKVDIRLICEFLAQELVKEWEADVNSWTRQDAVAAYAKIKFDDELIKSLYSQYKQVVVRPPNPDVTPVVFTAGEKQRVLERALAWKLHNMLMAMPEPAYNRYGQVVSGMRQILYLGQKYIPEIARKDYSHDMLWWSLHNDWTAKTDAAYAELFRERLLEIRKKG